MSDPASNFSPLLALQFDEEFISDLVRCTTDEVPMPDCALTLLFVELAGGRIKDSKAPFGLKAGGTT